MRTIKQVRTRHSQALEARSEKGQPKVIAGYFAVFNRETELWQGAFEEIAPTAFDSSMFNDVRCLVDHETRLVLGRTKAGTLKLIVDKIGLYGEVNINEQDTDAMNLYERVQRGDVDQCSFGFEIVAEETEFRDDGTIKWTIKEVKLHEVSIVTFPAYEETGVQARKQEVEQHYERQLAVRKQQLKERIKNGIKTIDVTQEIE